MDWLMSHRFIIAHFRPVKSLLFTMLAPLVNVRLDHPQPIVLPFQGLSVGGKARATLTIAWTATTGFCTVPHSRPGRSDRHFSLTPTPTWLSQPVQTSTWVRDLPVSHLNSGSILLMSP